MQCAAQPSPAQPSARRTRCTHVPFPPSFALPGGPSGPSGLPTPRSLGGTPDTPPGRAREGGFQCVESAEDATGGGMQRQGGISAPGWRLLQAIAGVHLTNAQTGSPGIQPSRLLDTGVHWYFRSCRILSRQYLPPPYVLAHPVRTRLYSMYLTYLSVHPPSCLPSQVGGWMDGQQERQTKSD